MYEPQLVQSPLIYHQSITKSYGYEFITANYQKVPGKKRMVTQMVQDTWNLDFGRFGSTLYMYRCARVTHISTEV